MLSKREKIFIVLSCVFSVLHACGYILQGIKTGFNICIYLMAALDLLYIPAVMKKEKLFPYYLGVFSLCLLFILAFTESRLFNNYSSLLCAFIGILLFPRLKRVFIIAYLIAAGVAFSVAGDEVFLYVIHISRAIWLYLIYSFIIYERYNRKPVILYDNEREILKQLADGKIIKEVQLFNYSERTIRRRLEAARKRNGVKNNNELILLYKKTYENIK